MKTLWPFISIFLYCLTTLAQKKETIVVDFLEKQQRAHMLELREDSLRFQIMKDTVMISSEDIFKLKFQTKKESRFGSTLLGMVVGSIPGLVYLQFAKNKDRDLIGVVFEAPAEFGLGFGMVLTGIIVGGIVGNHLGKGSSIEIPIFGKKDLYQKQKEKIRQLGMD